MRLIHPKATDGNRGWKSRAFWGCMQYPGCRGTHGAHQETGLPLGTPANEATRRARMQAHEEFDQLWKTAGWLTRTMAYAWITEAMQQPTQIHIGSATIEECSEICKLSRAKATELAGQQQGKERRLKKQKKYRQGRRANFEQAKRTASKLDRKAERRHQSAPPQAPVPEPEDKPPRESLAVYKRRALRQLRYRATYELDKLRTEKLMKGSEAREWQLKQCGGTRIECLQSGRLQRLIGQIAEKRSELEARREREAKRKAEPAPWVTWIDRGAALGLFAALDDSSVFTLAEGVAFPDDDDELEFADVERHAGTWAGGTT